MPPGDMGSVLVLETDEVLRQKLLLGLRGQGIDAEAVKAAAIIGRIRGSAAGSQVEALVVGPHGPAVAELVEALSQAPALADEGGRTASSAAPFLPIIAIIDARGEASGAPLKLSEARSPIRMAPAAVAAADHDPVVAGLRAMHDGATDFVLSAAGVEGIALALRKVQARRAAIAPASGTVAAPGAAAAIAPPAGASRPVLVGASPKIAAVLTLVRRLAGVRTAVLVGGESGTGKELIAQALHGQSPWRAGPFVAVNCGAIPAGLIESELFGHVRGAFTDAVRDKQGLFQAAHGGTLFLDEIADLPLALQPKLLRALQEGVFRRVGDSADTRVEVRVVAATARELTAEVAARRFREDLYYRLAGLTIHIPPLRERSADIPLLAAHFLARARTRLGVKVHAIDPEALRILTAYAWPGNVRELENTIERAAVLCSDDRIDVASLPERLLAAVPPIGGPTAALHPADGAGGTAPPSNKEDTEPGALSIKQAARRSEQDLIQRALAVTAGNRTRAAYLLEISHRALLYKIKEYKILVPRGAPREGPK